ncbi:GNAT family N-acetyltransferase [Nocardia heshunensis]
MARSILSSTTVESPAPRELWRRLHEDDREAVPTQAAEWLDCVTSLGGWRDASRLYHLPDGRSAVLPLVRRRMPGPGILRSLPEAWGFGGLVAPGGVDAELVSAVADDLCTTPAARIYVRPNPLHADAWAGALTDRPGVTAVPMRAHVLDLTGGFEQVWHERFKAATRTDVRKARKSGVRIETDTTGRLVPVFYDLLLRSFDRWAEQQHEPLWLTRWRGRRRDPIDKFAVIAERMGERCRISVAWLDDRPAAAIVVLRGGFNAHYTRGAMDQEVAGRAQVNCLLHATAIEDACAAGCRAYHFGETGGSARLAQFKNRFGAQPREYAGYWIERVPVYRADRLVRTGVKRVIGFRDA